MLRLLILASLVLPVSVQAQTATHAIHTEPVAGVPVDHSLDLSKPILDLDGKPVPNPFNVTKDDPTCAKCEPLTYAAAIIGAVSNPGPEVTDGAQKQARFELAKRIKANPQHVNLSAAEVVAIKKDTSRIFGPVVIGPLNEAIDPGAATPEIK